MQFFKANGFHDAKPKVSVHWSYISLLV